MMIYMRIILLLFITLLVLILFQYNRAGGSAQNPQDTTEEMPHPNIRVKLVGTDVIGWETANTRQLQAEGRDIKMVVRHNKVTDVVSGDAWLKEQENVLFVSFSGVAGMVECDYAVKLMPNQDYIQHQVESVLSLIVSLPPNSIQAEQSELVAKE